MQTLFTILITLQFLVIVLHDCLDIPRLHYGRRVRAVIGPRKFWLGTLINALFPALAVGYAFYFWNRPKPSFVTDYWAIYCAITLASAIGMWYIPYFFGTNEKNKDEYTRMYAGTIQVLPPRGNNPCPNLLHLCFHALFVITLCLSLFLRFSRA